MNNTHESWKKFLHPETLKKNLIAISLFITAYEIFKSSIIEKPETFFSDGIDKNGIIINKVKYNKEVLSLSQNKNKLYASLLWFKEMEAINESDITVFDNIRIYRNELAHEPILFLSEIDKSFDPEKFQDLIHLLAKVEKWWFINFEAAIDPDILPEGADPNEVIPGPIWSLQLMQDIALGNEPEEGFYYNGFKEKINLTI